MHMHVRMPDPDTAVMDQEPIASSAGLFNSLKPAGVRIQKIMHHDLVGLRL